MTETITLRIWTNLGKENIRSISDFRVHNGEIQITSQHLDDILEIIKAGHPCTLSFLTCTSENQVGRYRDHTYRGCMLVKDKIVFKALCVPA